MTEEEIGRRQLATQRLGRSQEIGNVGRLEIRLREISLALPHSGEIESEYRAALLHPSNSAMRFVLRRSLDEPKA